MIRAVAGRIGIAVGTLVGYALFGAPEPAYACSGDPFDPNQAALIAEGWVERFTLRPDLLPAPAGSTPESALIPAEVSLRVARSLKGNAPAQLTFIDWGSVAPGPNGSIFFVAGGGPCGILREDPTGKYALVVFTRDAEGNWRVGAIQGAQIDDGPDAPNIQLFRRYLMDRLAPTAPPRTGEGGAAKQTALNPGDGLPLAGALLTIGALSLRGRMLARRQRQR